MARSNWRARREFELLTPRFVVWCSIQLSYGRLNPPRTAKASPARGRALAAFGEAGKTEPP